MSSQLKSTAAKFSSVSSEAATRLRGRSAPSRRSKTMPCSKPCSPLRATALCWSSMAGGLCAGRRPDRSLRRAQRLAGPHPVGCGARLCTAPEHRPRHQGPRHQSGQERQIRIRRGGRTRPLRRRHLPARPLGLLRLRWHTRLRPQIAKVAVSVRYPLAEYNFTCASRALRPAA